MPSKKEQAGEILAKALGVDVDPPPPPPKVVDSTPEKVIDQVSESTEDTENEPHASDEAASLADVAEMLGVEVSDLYDVQVPQLDGAKPVPLGKLKDAEKRARDLEKKLRGLESDNEMAKKELDALRQQAPAAFGGMPPELDALRMRAAQWHEHVYNNQAYWDALKENDPVEFAAESRQAEMQANQIAGQFQQAFRQWQQYQSRQLRDVLSEKRRKLAEIDSAWASEDTRKERYKLISDWLRDGNATVPDNLDEILVDPGWANRLYEAAAAAKGAKLTEGVPKKVGTAKLTRGSLKRINPERANLVDLVKRAKETGKSADKLAAGTAILEDAMRPRKR